MTEENPNQGSLPPDLAPDANEPGDSELSPEIADLADGPDDGPAPDEVDQRPESEIEVPE